MSRVNILTRVMSSQSAAAGPGSSSLVVIENKKGVTTVRMNNPKRLNGWTEKMMDAFQAGIAEAAVSENCKALIVTGTDPYYCAGVDLSATIRPMHPAKLHAMIETKNRSLFERFINFPKPIMVAANGPAIGASFTSATLCDAIVASDKATFNTPFSALGVPPEGCSSVHFERVMGAETAQRMLGPEGWKPTAAEAHAAGFVQEVVPHDDLMDRAQAIAEQWIAEGKVRSLVEKGCVEEYLAVNAKESRDLADAFFDVPFLQGQHDFLISKGKADKARIFHWLIKTRPLWRPLAP